MAVTKDEVYGSKELQDLVDRAEKVIDELLKEAGLTTRKDSDIWISIDDLRLSGAVIEELIERYNQVGWQVRFESDQRDGSALVFS